MLFGSSMAFHSVGVGIHCGSFADDVDSDKDLTND